MFQGDLHRFLVNGLDETGSERLVNVHSGRQDSAGQLLEYVRHRYGLPIIGHENTKERKSKKLSQDDAFDGQCGGVEVEQQADVESGGPQVGASLGVVVLDQAGNRLQLDDDLLADN